MMNAQAEHGANRERSGHARRLANPAAAGLSWTVFAVWQAIRCAICAVLVLGEPVLRAVLVPVAFQGILVTVIFGFLIGDPRFPRCGMLAFSVGAQVLYWLYLGLMGVYLDKCGDATHSTIAYPVLQPVSRKTRHADNSSYGSSI
jgi:hypothetical protein